MEVLRVEPLHEKQQRKKNLKARGGRAARQRELKLNRKFAAETTSLTLETC